jgi:hypothetical protein
MNYDKIILELLSRVQNLEEEMGAVKQKVLAESDDETLDESGITRAEARDAAIKELQKRFPDYIVEKAPRVHGSGIQIHLPTRKQPHFIKFYHSRVYDGGHGWHVVKLVDVRDLAYCMFSLLDTEGIYHYFIFGTDEIGEYQESHRADTNADKLHLYFSVNGKTATESREGIVDVSDHLDNWQILDENHICD